MERGGGEEEGIIHSPSFTDTLTEEAQPSPRGLSGVIGLQLSLWALSTTSQLFFLTSKIPLRSGWSSTSPVAASFPFSSPLE